MNLLFLFSTFLFFQIPQIGNSFVFNSVNSKLKTKSNTKLNYTIYDEGDDKNDKNDKNGKNGKNGKNNKNKNNKNDKNKNESTNSTDLTETEIRWKHRRLKQNNSSGFDSRTSENETENEIVLLKIQENIYVYNLLKKLMSPYLQQNSKLKAWYEYVDYYEVKLNGSSKFAPDLTRGGLFKDWDFEL